MLPCGESHTSASQDEAASPSAAALERSNSAFASVDTDSGQQAPNMLVVVLAGFQATSRTTEARVSGYASPGVIVDWPVVFRNNANYSAVSLVSIVAVGHPAQLDSGRPPAQATEIKVL